MTREPHHGSDQPDGAPSGLREFGKYVLLKELGRGAQGVVYLAEDQQLHRKVALKMLTAAGVQSDEIRERFVREAEVASKLEHPGICGVHEMGDVEGVPYIAMQYVVGTTLADLLEGARGDAPAAPEPSVGTTLTSASFVSKDATQDVVRLIERAARALHAAHEVGLVHRDVKPANIMITPDGDPVLLDFGLARDVEDDSVALTQTGQIMGTPAYLSVEQIRGDRDQVDRRADVYALGVTLYECLTLRRPFDSTSFQELFHDIANSIPPSPRKLNPRIPRDLATVIEVAMERDRNRRYQTALEFAEDLRRVRSFEPIRAKAAGPVVRARKWMYRHPAKSVAIGAGLIAVVSLITLDIHDRVQKQNNIRARLHEARMSLDAGDFGAALQAVAKVDEWDPESSEADLLEARIERAREEAEREERRRVGLAEAATARSDAAHRQREYAKTVARLTEIGRQLESERVAVFSDWAPRAERAKFADRQLEVRKLESDAANLIRRARESLELAARLEAPWGRTPATDAAFARYYLERWREAVAANDTLRASIYRADVERYDEAGAFRDELLGLGSLSIATEPDGAECYLFRYEPYESVREHGGAIPRLVPVPTAGRGRCRDLGWVAGFGPGDPCLVIEEVAEGSPAAAAGLRAGDLVVGVDGAPAVGVLFLVPAVAAAGPSEVDAIVCIESRNGIPIENVVDWANAAARAENGLDCVVLRGCAEALECDASALAVADARTFVERGAPRALRLQCLANGESSTLALPAGQASGLRTEQTANPLICSPANRLSGRDRIVVDPGSYVLVSRAAGFELQRIPFVVERRAAVDAVVTLLPIGSTPPGFRFVPPGPFRVGGDPEASDPLESRVVDVAGYFIGRRELTNREWREFVEHPATRDAIRAGGELTFVPRERIDGPIVAIPTENLGGPEAPVMGLSWHDARAYCEWRNARAVERGEPWVFDLPTEDEWAKAARGVDGRTFPWGDRFDFALVVGWHSGPEKLYAAPAGLQPRDESPYGVFDMAGLRREFTSTEYDSGRDGPPFYRTRGGSWASSRAQHYRCASRTWAVSTYVGGDVGFRIVARPR